MPTVWAYMHASVLSIGYIAQVQLLLIAHIADSDTGSTCIVRSYDPGHTVFVTYSLFMEKKKKF